ncbi:hypothetical protein KKA47_00245 [bacterium]|nr:hypothetical protein [bacterium]
MLGIKPPRGKKIGKKYQKYYFKQRLNRILYPLQNRYKLITINRANDTVRRASLDRSGKEALLPDTFWTRGWKLSFAAKYFYLISLLETIDSPFYPWWHMSMRALKVKYHCDHSIGKGADELVRVGILEILEGIPIKRGTRWSEEANYYRLNPL